MLVLAVSILLFRSHPVEIRSDTLQRIHAFAPVSSKVKALIYVCITNAEVTSESVYKLALATLSPKYISDMPERDKSRSTEDG